MSNVPVVCLILAAGASTRMGQPKALLPWGDTTVLEHILGQVRMAGIPETILVTGAHHREILKATDPSICHIRYNDRWEEGMGTSLACGLGYARKTFHDSNAILVLLSDQPLVSADFLKQMIRLSREHPGKIVASGYGESAGVPALFPGRFWPLLHQLPSAQGARQFIREQQKHTVVLDPGEATTDIDTPASYLRALGIAGLEAK